MKNKKTLKIRIGGIVTYHGSTIRYPTGPQWETSYTEIETMNGKHYLLWGNLATSYPEGVYISVDGSISASDYLAADGFTAISILRSKLTSAIPRFGFEVIK